MMNDGVSKLWILRTHAGLDVDGFKDEVAAIEQLIRTALIFGPAGTRERIEMAVAKCLRHMDEAAPDGEQ